MLDLSADGASARSPRSSAINAPASRMRVIAWFAAAERRGPCWAAALLVVEASLLGHLLLGYDAVRRLVLRDELTEGGQASILLGPARASRR